MPSKLPCHTVFGDVLEPQLQAALRASLVPAQHAVAGDLVAIGQSWSVQGDDAQRDACLGFWQMTGEGYLEPFSFSQLSETAQSSVAVAGLHLLDNAYARHYIRPIASKMVSGKQETWIDGLHFAEGVFLYDTENPTPALLFGTVGRSIDLSFRMLAQTTESHHQRLSALSGINGFLAAFTGHLLGRKPGPRDHTLVAEAA